MVLGEGGVPVLKLEFVMADLCNVACLFILFMPEDIYLVPYVGVMKAVFLMVAHTKHSAAEEETDRLLFLLTFRLHWCRSALVF